MTVHMVQLAPRGWVPDSSTGTGGNHPSVYIYISYTYWQFLDSPQSIEDYYEKLATLEAKPLINTINFRGSQSPQEL